MKLRARGVVAASVVLATAVLGACERRQPWEHQLVSVNAAGTGSGNARSTEAVLSPDGTKVAFTSDADDLGPTDTNDTSDIYLRDLTSGATTLVSVNADGTDSGNGLSLAPAWSGDGTKIVFHSDAGDLGPTDTNHVTDLYIRDLVAGTTTLVSANAAGTDSGNQDAWNPVFSPDGSKVAFGTEAHDLGPTDTNEDWDVYVRDLVAGTTTLVSVNATGTSGGNEDTCCHATFSPDGTKVAFTSYASDLGPTDTNGAADIYLRDLTSEVTTLLSTRSDGTDGGNGLSVDAVFSPDGSKVAFHSAAADLGPTDTNGAADVYVRDLVAGTTALVSANAAGTDGGNGRSGEVPRWGVGPPSFGHDGTSVVFVSEASDLGPTDTNGDVDVYVRDLLAGTTALVSVNAAGTDAADGPSFVPAVSPDGAKVAFTSGAADLTSLDTTGRFQVYVRDLADETTTLVSADAAGAAPSYGISGLFVTAQGGAGVFGADGRRLVFTSSASDLDPLDDDPDSAEDEVYDVFVADLREAEVSLEARAEPDRVAPGGTVTYRLDVANRGPDTAEEVTLYLRHTGTTRFLDAETSRGRCFYLGNLPPGGLGPLPIVVCQLGDLPSDGTAEVTVRLRANAPAGTSIEVVAAAGAERTSDPRPNNNARVVTTAVTGS